MPFNWTDENVRDMLIYTIVGADLKPPTATWQLVAQKLGGDLNANAVSQKFYKLKRESEKLTAPAASTPTKTPTRPKTPATSGRKRKTNADETPSKHPKKNANDQSDKEDNVDQAAVKDEPSQEDEVKQEDLE